jgi:hypothetical protein
MSDPLSRRWRGHVQFFSGFLGLWVLVGLVGCGSSQLQPPHLVPREVAAQAIKQYDKNGDGLLDADELEHCPGLKSQLRVIDTNKDGKLSADEIAERLNMMVEAKIARVGVFIRVNLDEQPLEGATVRLVPEKFMGESVQPAVGTTDKTGIANMQLEEGAKKEKGVQWGYYRIEVSRKDSDGKETLPAKFNTATTLGCEVSPDMRGGIVLKLSS